tara:strand:- start:88 stop:465 length:378 start_codon:yes stop_codon:yes gene_type:complete
MAWEMDREMHSWIEPSITHYLEDYFDPHWDPIELDGLSIFCPVTGWLCLRYADQRWDGNKISGYDALCREALELDRLGQHLLIRAITESAVEFSTTSNGGGEIYLSSGCHGVPWCSEDYQLAWYS